MNLIINKMMKLQIVHMTNSYWAIKVLTCSTITKSNFSISLDWHTLPKLSVIKMFSEILHHTLIKCFLVFIAKFFPLRVDIVIGHFEHIHNVSLVRTIKHRSCHIKSKSFCCQRQVNLKNLPNIHTRRHTQRIQYDIQWSSIWKKWHILHR